MTAVSPNHPQEWISERKPQADDDPAVPEQEKNSYWHWR
jgi:hypothetical protein